MSYTAKHAREIVSEYQPQLRDEFHLEYDDTPSNLGHTYINCTNPTGRTVFSVRVNRGCERDAKSLKEIEAHVRRMLNRNGATRTKFAAVGTLGEKLQEAGVSRVVTLQMPPPPKEPTPMQTPHVNGATPATTLKEATEKEPRKIRRLSERQKVAMTRALDRVGALSDEKSEDGFYYVYEGAASDATTAIEANKICPPVEEHPHAINEDDIAKHRKEHFGMIKSERKATPEHKATQTHGLKIHYLTTQIETMQSQLLEFAKRMEAIEAAITKP